MQPDAAGWRRLARAVAPRASVVRVRRMGGGLSTETYAVDLDGAAVTRLVVKQYRPGDRGAAQEFERLEVARRAAVPSPRPLAVDAAGDWLGAPALVMERLPGGPDVRPRDVGAWLDDLASAIVAIHETDTRGVPRSMRPPRTPEAWRPPRGLPRTPFVERVVAAIERHPPVPDTTPVLIHGDFHPGNVVWRRRRLSGVVDWSGARIGSRWHELAYCRADTVLLFGTDVADGLTRRYVERCGLQPADLAVLDLVCGLNARAWGRYWLRAYSEQGRTDTMRQCAARVTAHLSRALAELGA